MAVDGEGLGGLWPGQASTSSVTQTGRPTPILGSGRPASAAAARMVGMTWDSMVAGPVIQVTVPAAIRPAMLQHGGPEGGHQHRRPRRVDLRGARRSRR